MPEQREPQLPGTTNKRWNGYFVLAGMLVLTILKLWLTSWQEIEAQGSARFDDYLFVQLADHLRHGEWLGDYNERTLVKGPVYPMWLAAVSLAHLPLLPAQHVLHAVAAGALVFVMRRMFPHRSAQLALFALLIFDPGTYETTTHRVTREGIYTALALFVIAGAAAIATRPNLRGAAVWLWVALLGASLAAFWFTREEGPWILPVVAILLIAAAVSRIRSKEQSRKIVALLPLVLPLLLFGTAHMALAQINRHCYGAAATIELREPWFAHAYGSLTRVDPAHALWRVPVSAAARAQIYTASPAFAELKPHLEGRSQLSQPLPDADPDSSAPPEEMTGTWFVWALRDAVAAAGHHDTLAHARSYYEKLAAEVDTACAEGRLNCAPPHASLAPAWRPEYAEKCWRFVRRITNNILSMRTVQVEQPPSAGNTPETFRLYENVTHMRINGMRPDTQSDGFFAMSVLQVLAAAYKLCLYLVAILGSVVFLIGLAADYRARKLSPEMLLATAILATVLTRIALLTYISASAYPIFHGIYLRVLYPLLYIFIALCLARIVTLRNNHHRDTEFTEKPNT